MKAVMISIRPEWCEKILSGEKTVEVRRSRPKLQTPFKCYIYCTRGNKETLRHGRVIAEFICDYIYNDFGHCSGQEQLDSDMPGTAMTFQQYDKYCYGYVGYGWHITNLKVYSEPEEITNFMKPCITPEYPYCPLCECGYESISEEEEEYYREYGTCSTEWICLNNLKKAPQSWCYVEEL